MSFKPIAIVGRSCVLPGALSPEALWEAVSEGRDLTSSAPSGRWAIDADLILGDGSRGAAGAPDRAWSDRGGYVRGFEEVFDPQGFEVDAEELTGLDPLFLWALHAGREALRDANRAGASADVARVGAIFGNLGFPSSSFSRFAEQTWFAGSELGPSGEPVDPRNRFMNGLPALFMARALGLGAGAFTLDAACASALYAIKMACDKLHDGDADLMLAGAVNRSDDLFIHVGFSALDALSRSGRSRPFHAQADGLLPAEGAAFVALKRLDDAQRDGDHIHGVIRGVGLSNDGRSRGFLVPSEEGQARAIHTAWEMAGLDPATAGLLECHATGTQVGDAAELRSSAQVFGAAQGLPIGSLKSNMGHGITVAGVAGLIKVLEAMRAGVRPPTLWASEPNAALEGSPFRLLTEAEPWPEDARRAGVSAFGFGGNNAHLVVEAYQGESAAVADPQPQSAAQPVGPVAVVGMGVIAGSAYGVDAFNAALFDHDIAVEPQLGKVHIPLKGLRFPPKDLEQTLGQQLAILAAAGEAVAGLAPLDPDRTGVFAGMGTDPEVARYGARWRMAQWMRDGAQPAASDADLAAARDGIVPLLRSAGVLGAMPNIPANRLNSHFDLRGASAVVSAEEASGLVALDVALRALRSGELDAALVGAVDLSDEAVHREAQGLLPEALRAPADGAVVLVLQRLEDATRLQSPILAVIGDDDEGSLLTLGLAPKATSLVPRLGHAHAASGLLHVAAAVSVLNARRQVGGAPWLRGETPRGAKVCVQTLDGYRRAVTLTEGSAASRSSGRYALEVYRGADRPAVLKRLAAGEVGGDGPSCLAIIDDGVVDMVARRRRAQRHLEAGAPAGRGVHFREAPIKGDVAQVFTGAGAAYQGMGLSLLKVLPELGDALVDGGFGGLADALAWSLDPKTRPGSVTEKLWGSSALCQLHNRLSRDILGLRPVATLGYSSGETNALFATGVWCDLDAMRADARASGLFDRELGGTFDAVARAWGEPKADWALWTVLAPIEEIREAVADERHVHLAIIHTADDGIIAGSSEGCERVVAKLGAGRCHRLDYDLAVHVPELETVGDAWLELHRREVHPAELGERIYSNAGSSPIDPTAEGCALAILNQATKTVDFPKTVLRAYNDGIRVFVEHGPQGACARWIKAILGDRDAVVVSLDQKGQGIEASLDACAALVAAGVDINAQALFERLSPPAGRHGGPGLTFPAHWPPVRLPEPKRNLPMSSSPSAPRVEAALPTPSPSPTQAPRHAIPRGQIAVEPAGATWMPVAPNLPMWGEGAPPVIYANAQPQQAQPFVPQRKSGDVAPGTSGLSDVHGQLLGMGAGFLEQLAAFSLHQPMAPRQAYPHAAIAPAPSPVVPWPAPPQAPPAPVPPRAGPVLPSPAAPVEVAQAAPSPSTRPQPQGLSLSREQLKIHASGDISEIYGPLFADQDAYARQCRMPEPPLLLADRVTGIDAEPASMGLGTIWTETDVTWDSWYLNQGFMPAGVMIESGQADLMLISYLGIDLLNKGERVYRLLGCELTYHGDLPRPGETLQYDIHVDGHAQQGDIRLFFFHYDCEVNGEPRLSVRGGQAGFFTDQELADSAGCLWTPEEQEIVTEPRLDPPEQATTRTTFGADDIQAFAEGRPWQCFGEGFEFSQTHVRSPRIQTGKMTFLHRVTELNIGGGPWGRGYLRAEQDLTEGDWFFKGHFKNDPCMPGTLMFEGCLQAMSFYLAAMGFTLKRDGWRFQPVTEEPFPLRCRGQATPESRLLTYEIFIEEVIGGDTPTIYADLLCTIDGLKAFHGRRVGLQLVADWPLSSQPELLGDYVEPKAVAKAGDFAFDYASLLACAWGRPSDAFGEMYAIFDGHRRVARLPGPPYHFMSRVTHVDGPVGEMTPGVTIELEYDIPEDAWYYNENGCRTMPFAVLLEAALQPCGWLASFVGSATTVDEDLSFRNLDGTGTLHDELMSDAGTLRTRVTLTKISQTAGMIIEGFKVACFLGEREVYTMDTVFGFFPKVALENQVGLPTTDAQRELLNRPSDTFIDLTERPEVFCSGGARLAEPMLLMLDRLTGLWPDGGKKGLGQLRGEKDVDAGEWFFKAHFFQDPVQPGSLGIEAMIQLLQLYMLNSGMADGIPNARFEPLATGAPLTWKYRGQVIPSNRVISTTLEIVEVGRDDKGPYAIGEASLWVDGKRIYEASNMGMRIVSTPVTGDGRRRTLDLETSPWIGDHRPTYTVPALPMMSMLDLMAQAMPRPVVGCRDMKVKRWLIVDGSVTTEVEVEGDVARLRAQWGGGQWAEVASATFLTGQYPEPPDPWEPIEGPVEPSLYESGRLFHGPAFQVQRSLIMGTSGSTAILDAAATSVPVGALHPALLDGATHGIPHDQLRLWFHDADDEHVAYPALLRRLDLYGPPPTSGEVRCEVRPAGHFGVSTMPKFEAQLIHEGRVWATMELVEAAFPKGPLGRAEPLLRQAFLRDGAYQPGVHLSLQVGDVTRLDQQTVDSSNWLPGTIKAVYGTEDLETIALKEHQGGQVGVHPGKMPGGAPLTRFSQRVERSGDAVRVETTAPAVLSLEPVKAFWDQHFDRGRWPVEDLYYGMIQRFVRNVIVEDPEGFEAIKGRSALYLANHQVAVESLIFAIVASGLTHVPTITVAKAEHRTSWLGQLIQHCFAYPGVVDPRVITYFDRDDKESLLKIIAELAGEMAGGARSVMVHIEGTRSLTCRKPVEKMSGAFIDMALKVNAPVVPVRFVGGLPVEPLEKRIEFPVGMGKQDLYIGRPLLPEDLGSVPYGERKALVIRGINNLGPRAEEECPLPGDGAFAARVDSWQSRTGASHEHAALMEILKEYASPCEESKKLLRGVEDGHLTLGEGDEARWLGELARRLFGSRGPKVG